MSPRAKNSQKSQNLIDMHRDSVLLVPLFICVFLFLTSAMAIFTNLGVFDGKRILQVGLLPLIFLFALIHPTLRRTSVQLIFQTPLFIKLTLLVMFAIGFVSAVRFPHPGYSLLDISVLFCLILLVYIVAATRIVAQTKFDKLVMIGLISITTVVAVQELMGLLANVSLGLEFAYDSMFIYFTHPRFYNQIQTWAIPILAALPFVFKANRIMIILTIFLLSFQWYLLFGSGARGSVVSLTVALLLMLILVRPSGRRLIKMQIGGALLGMVFYYAVSLVQKTHGASQFIAQSLGRNMSTSNGRITFWRYAWNDALTNPWLGAGPGRFACNADIALPSHPHNFAMQILSEWGFPAIILLFSLAMYIAWLILRSSDSTAQDQRGISLLQLSLLTSLLAAVIHSSVSGLLVMPPSTMMGALACGWLLASSVHLHKPASLPLVPYTVLIVGFLISTQMFTFSLSETKSFNQRFESFGPTDRQMPRFWNRGRICRYNYKYD